MLKLHISLKFLRRQTLGMPRREPAAVPCSPEQLRCLAHSHIGCTCSWQLKSLLQRLPDAELLRARREMNDLAAKVQSSHSSDKVSTLLRCRRTGVVTESRDKS